MTPEAVMKTSARLKGTEIASKGMHPWKANSPGIFYAERGQVPLQFNGSYLTESEQTSWLPALSTNLAFEG